MPLLESPDGCDHREPDAHVCVGRRIRRPVQLFFPVFAKNACINGSTSTLPQPGHWTVVFIRSVTRMNSVNVFLHLRHSKSYSAMPLVLSVRECGAKIAASHDANQDRTGCGVLHDVH